MSRRSRTLRPAVALATLCALLAACSDADADADADQKATDGQSSPPAASPTVGELPGGVLALPEPVGEEGVVVDAGRYRIPLSETLAFDVDLPSGTQVNGDGLYLVHGGTILKVEAAGEEYGIPRNPCNGFEEITPAGPSVGDLVQAMRTEPLYRAGRPEPVQVGGAVGKYLELRIPSGYDASSCTDGQVGLPGNSGSNNTMEPGYLGQWWVLDADGQRAVVQTLCEKCDAVGSTPFTAAIESITFTTTP